jgi:adenylylsulfate kinase-like enzyme
VDTPHEECRRRDAKGLSARGQAQVPGVGVAFEPPLEPDVVVRPGEEDAAGRIAALLGPKPTDSRPSH